MAARTMMSLRPRGIDGCFRLGLPLVRQRDQVTRCAACRRLDRVVLKHGSRAPFSSASRRHATSGNGSAPSNPAQDQNDVVDASLPSQAEHRRSQASKRFSSVMDNLQSNIFQASQRLNDLTGYSGIETLKRSIEAQEEHVQRTRAAVRAAKEAYSTAIAQRSASQREVNELLQRKHAWTPHDLERFTALYRSDHANEQAEAKAAEDLADAERSAEEAGAKLSRSILARYHEEQIWSDKIRRMSTWGTWGLMGVNVLLFVIFQVGVEPWRRKRLVNGFEEKVREAIERDRLTPVSGDLHVVDDRKLTSISDTPSDHAKVDSSKLVQLEDAHLHSAEQPSLETLSPSPISSPSISTLPSDPSLTPIPTADPCPSPASLIDPQPRSSSTFTIPLFLQRYLPKRFITSLFSNEHVSLRKVDVTVIVLEGFTAGVAVCAVVCLGVLRRG